MTSAPTDTTAGQFEVERIEHVFDRIPTMIASSLLAIFLVFVFLFESLGGNTVKGWAAYMLSLMAVHGWLWHAHRNAAPTAREARYWEYGLSLGALLIGAGWGLLAGPLYPAQDMSSSHFVMLMTSAVAFSAATHYSLSHLGFAAILLPTLLPIGVRLAYSAHSPYDGTVLTVVALFGVTLMLQRVQYTTVMENLRRRLESETLLEEQQAIFQSASQGIAVVSGVHIVKCNHRLGEMLGRRLQELYALGLGEHCVDQAEFLRLLADSQEAFRRDHNYHGMVRLMRADGSSFWAEISAHRMHGEDETRSVWLIAEAPVKHGAHGPRS